MSPQNQNRNGKSIGFFKATSMIALLLGTTSLTTPEVYASKLALALAANLAEKEGIARAEAQSIVNMAMRKDALHPEAAFNELLKTKQDGHIDSFIEAERELLQSNKKLDEFLEEKRTRALNTIHDADGGYVTGRDTSAYPGDTAKQERKPLSPHERAFFVCRARQKDLNTQEGQDFFNETLAFFQYVEKTLSDLIEITAALEQKIGGRPSTD